MSDLTRRSVLTVLALLAAWAVGRLPQPGAGSSDFMPGWGAPGLAPIVAASMLLSLVALLLPGIFRTRTAFDLWTGGLAAALTLLMAVNVASRMSNPATGVLLGPGAAAAVIAAACSGTVILALLAWLVSAWGMGNGLSLIFLITTVEEVAAQFAGVRAGPGSGEALLPVLLISLGWGALLVMWFRARWIMPLPGTGDGPTARGVAVSRAALGGMAMTFALGAGSWLYNVGMMFPADSSGFDVLTAFGTEPILQVLAFVVTAIAAGWLWTTQVFDPRGPLGPGESRAGFPGARRAVAPTAFAPNAIALRETRGFLVGAPIAAGFLFVWFPEIGALELSPLWFLPWIAVVLDTARQWKEHEGLAHAPGVPGPARCGACGEAMGEDDDSCVLCGMLFVDGVACAVHGERAAVARCILCARGLCAECTHAANARSRCAAHERAELIGAWVTVEQPPTRVLAEEAADRLRARGIEARVLANSPTGLYGSPGLYDLRDLVPLAAHPELLGARNRVLVPARRWREVVGVEAAG